MAKKKFYGFHSGFAELLNEFIEHKCSLGYVEASYFHLNSFDAFCADKYPNAHELTQDIVTEWCGISNKGIINRCSQIREFAKYLISTGKPAYIYPATAIPKRNNGLPYIISQQEQSTLSWNGLQLRCGCISWQIISLSTRHIKKEILGLVVSSALWEGGKEIFYSILHIQKKLVHMFL